MPVQPQVERYTCSLKVRVCHITDGFFPSGLLDDITLDMTLMKILGYFAFNHASLPAMQDLFGQMWKEYSYADSRYLISDPFVLCMETVTAVRSPSLDESSIEPETQFFN